MLRMRVSRLWSWLPMLLAVTLTTLSLAACSGDLANMSASAINATPARPAFNGPSPRAATVALASFDGVPGALAQRFQAQLSTQALARDISLTDAASAAYLVRGYLTIRNEEDGVSVGYVWDLFDRERHRAQRVEDAVALGKSAGQTQQEAAGSPEDAWSQVDDKVLQSIAARSMDDLATFLSTTPEAQRSVAQAGAPQVANSASASATTASATTAPATLGFAAR